jgi:hypothetical protein
MQNTSKMSCYELRFPCDSMGWKFRYLYAKIISGTICFEFKVASTREFLSSKTKYKLAVFYYKKHSVSFAENYSLVHPILIVNGLFNLHFEKVETVTMISSKSILNLFWDCQKKIGNFSEFGR